MRIRRSSAALVLAAATLLAGLSGCLPISTAPTPTPTGTTPSESPTPSETPVVEEPTGLSDSDIENIVAAIETGNTAAVEGYLAESVNFILAATECCGLITRAEAIANLDYTQNATPPWTYPTPEATVDVYRTGFYVAYFPEGAIVMHSSDADPMVMSLTLTGDEITGIFISAAESLLMP